MADETEVPRLVDQSLDTSLAHLHRPGEARAGRGAGARAARADPHARRARVSAAAAAGRVGRARSLPRARARRSRRRRDLPARGRLAASISSRGVQRRARDVPRGRAGCTSRATSCSRRISGGWSRSGRRATPRSRDCSTASPRTSSRRTASRAPATGSIPTRTTTIRTPTAGKRHRARGATGSVRPVESILRAFSRDLNVVLARRHPQDVRDRAGAVPEGARRPIAARLLGRAAARRRAAAGGWTSSRRAATGSKARYHHVLVDEFQDTSRKQWELVSLLVQAWGEGLGLADPARRSSSSATASSRSTASATPMSRCCRRRARFIDALRPGSTARALDRAQLPRRARAAGVRQRSLRRDGPERAPPRRLQVRRATTGFPIDAAQRRRARRGPVARRRHRRRLRRRAPRRSRPRSRASCARRPSATSRPASPRAATPGDIGILFRSRASHREFESALEAAGIPTYVYKGLGFFDADEIKDLSALIRFLADPSSELRAAAFLRSRFVRLSDPALAALAPRLAAALTVAGAARRARRARPTTTARRSSRRAGTCPRGWPASIACRRPTWSNSSCPRRPTPTSCAADARQQAWENLKKMRGLIRRIQNRGYATLRAHRRPSRFADRRRRVERRRSRRSTPST